MAAPNDTKLREAAQKLLDDWDSPRMGMQAKSFEDLRAELAAALAERQGVPSDAARDVLAERRRQVTAEGWTPEHDDDDDEHGRGELAAAAACYAHPDLIGSLGALVWPWRMEWWKPSDERRNLVKAGALILAEIERLDRAASPLPEAQPAQQAPDDTLRLMREFVAAHPDASAVAALCELVDVVRAHNCAGTSWGELFGRMMSALANADLALAAPSRGSAQPPSINTSDY